MYNRFILNIYNSSNESIELDKNWNEWFFKKEQLKQFKNRLTVKRKKNIDLIKVKKASSIKPLNYNIPSDISSASFFIVLTLLSINSSKNLLPKIKGQILIYPWVDFTLSMRSSDFNLSGATLTGDTISYFANHYLKDKKDEVNYEASPLFSKDLYNQPNTFIFAAELDPLLDEGIAYYNRLKSYGNNVIYKLYSDQLHGFVTNSKHFPKGLDCLKEISESAKQLVSDL